MGARTKADWRIETKRLRAARLPDRVAHDQSLGDHLATWLTRTAVPTAFVVTFDALPGEPDLSSLRSRCPSLRFAITRTPEEGFDLSIHPMDVEMEDHRFGYRQPVANAPTVPDYEIAVVLVPGLGFDRFGNRLGFGAGYYDRLLARVPQALRVGIADVLTGPLPVEEFDVPMTHLATVDGIVATETTV